MNPARNWNFDEDRPLAGEHDFASTVAHEMLHGIGFRGSAQSTGPNNSIFDGFGNPLTLYDSFLEDTSGNDPVPGGAAAPNQIQVVNAPGNDGQLIIWTGQDGTLQYGGGIPITTLNNWMPGSSLSHPYLPSTLMHFQHGPGEVQRVPLTHLLGMLQDLGYNVNNNVLNSYGAVYYLHFLKSRPASGAETVWPEKRLFGDTVVDSKTTGAHRRATDGILSRSAGMERLV